MLMCLLTQIRDADSEALVYDSEALVDMTPEALTSDALVLADSEADGPLATQALMDSDARSLLMHLLMRRFKLMYLLTQMRLVAAVLKRGDADSDAC